ncbi:type II toxin-antitoxin system PemK/MazF family toxin [Jonesia quinghaiensis]|uniref:type II toxin-antitoxin system PemK/MazF family toxin n=1 Tax=Jonesia quinghaiensis TaxID=262806 RepID=UPI0004029B8C|nr:type II toxin-antitoxin system PemK/MazF family toxin [Jonesia quinghaiensis]
MSSFPWRRIGAALFRALRPRASRPPHTPQPNQQSPRQSTPATLPHSDAPRRAGQYPGDYTGSFTATYDPHIDGNADPGEIVWAWVPFEEDHTQGKDRPVLLVGRDDQWLLGLMLSSRDRDQRMASNWVEIGSGPWDSQGRPSEVRVDRIIRVNPSSVRREGAVLPRGLFDQVIAATRRF